MGVLWTGEISDSSRIMDLEVQGGGINGCTRDRTADLGRGRDR